MIANSFEKALMNNPIRAWYQKHFEAKKLFSMGGPMAGGLALEIGCGRGVGSELIMSLFNADKIEAFDLDPHMVKLARKRLKNHSSRIKLSVGDATDIQVGDQFYDAVFIFGGVIHHIPNWQDALHEIYRVLKPGGRFYAHELFLGAEIYRERRTKPIAEVLIKSIELVGRVLTDHPQGEDCFNYTQFVKGIESSGLSVITSKDNGGSGYFIADKSKLK